MFKIISNLSFRIQATLQIHLPVSLFKFDQLVFYVIQADAPIESRGSVGEEGSRKIA